MITAIGAGDECVVSGQYRAREENAMVKIRIQGPTNELKRMKRVLERNRNLSILSASEVFPNKGTQKYFRQYLDITFDPVKNKAE